ncbi:MAG: hypothetical protein FJ098_02980 [Deltaproteobacteria bacterium]|nr:hypothetical protein [Deltaproteobacteria bacterium]
MRACHLLLALVLGSCGGGGEPVLVPLPEDPGSLFQGRGEDPVIATVGDWAITEGDLQAVHPVRPGATMEESLEALVDRVLAVQAGLDEGAAPRQDVLLSWRRALARRWLGWRFTEELRPETLPEHVLQAVWEVRWFLYDHENTFYVWDAQVICCQNPGGCDGEAFRRCMEESLDGMAHLQVFVRERAPASEEDFRAAVGEFTGRHAVPASLVKYSFQWDHSQPPERQGRYDRVDPAVAAAVETLSVPGVSELVRSPFGLHVLFLYRFLPEIHKTLADPEVQRDLSSNAYPAIQAQVSAATLGELFQGARVGLRTKVLEEVDWSGITGLRSESGR